MFCELLEVLCSTFGLRRSPVDRGSWRFPGMEREVRENWNERFAESPDVLKNPRRQQTGRRCSI